MAAGCCLIFEPWCLSVVLVNTSANEFAATKGTKSACADSLPQPTQVGFAHFVAAVSTAGCLEFEIHPVLSLAPTEPLHATRSVVAPVPYVAIGSRYSSTTFRTVIARRSSGVHSVMIRSTVLREFGQTESPCG